MKLGCVAIGSTASATSLLSLVTKSCLAAAPFDLDVSRLDDAPCVARATTRRAWPKKPLANSVAPLLVPESSCVFLGLASVPLVPGFGCEAAAGREGVFEHWIILFEDTERVCF
jgi:hypothetical protein